MQYAAWQGLGSRWVDRWAERSDSAREIQHIVIAQPVVTLRLTLLLLGHILPDGVVERAVQVTAYPQRIEIRYQIGFSENTLADQLRRLAPDAPVPGTPDETLEQYRQQILPRLAEGLLVEIDGQRVAVEPLEARRATLHHAQLECVFQVPIQATERPASLKIHDQNFADEPGSHRLAAKGRDGVALLNSSVPPILARVPVLPFEQLSEQQLESRRWIEAQIQSSTAAAAVASVDVADSGTTGDPLAGSGASDQSTTNQSGAKQPTAKQPTAGQQTAGQRTSVERSGGGRPVAALESALPPVVEDRAPRWRWSGRTVLAVLGGLGLLVGGGWMLAQRLCRR